MNCDHARREVLLVIRMQGRIKAELWLCKEPGCGDYIGTKPMSVRDFLSSNPAPCIDVHDGSALAGIDADDVRPLYVQHDPIHCRACGALILLGGSHARRTVENPPSCPQCGVGGALADGGHDADTVNVLLNGDRS